MKKITVIGGDNRLKIVKEEMQKSGYNVDSLGLFTDDCGDYKTSDIIILPVPTTKDKLHVFTPLTSKKIPLDEIYEISYILFAFLLTLGRKYNIIFASQPAFNENLLPNDE